VVKLAGLLHDIGHYACSHTFDDQVCAEIGIAHHEQRGVEMIQEMVKKYKIAITQDELSLICKLIVGDQSVQPTWLKDVVHNRENEIDCDKWDYLVRDSYHIGFGKPIQVARLIKHIKIMPIPITHSIINNDIKDSSQTHIDGEPLAMVALSGASAAERPPKGAEPLLKEAMGENKEVEYRLAYDRKVFMQVCDVFQTRYRLFREVYRHRVVVSVDRMIGQMMRLLVPLFRLWMRLGIRPNDAALAALPLYLPIAPEDLIDNATKNQVLEIWKKIQTRKHDRIRICNPTNNIHFPSATVVQVRLGLSSMQEDPVEKIWFYESGDRFAKHIKIHDVTQMIGSSPRVASETLHYQIQSI
jgi:HD superfamily phosphohydrolase